MQLQKPQFRNNIVAMLGGLMHKDTRVSTLTVLVFKMRASRSNTPLMVINFCKFVQVLKVCKTLNI